MEREREIADWRLRMLEKNRETWKISVMAIPLGEVPMTREGINHILVDNT